MTPETEQLIRQSWQQIEPDVGRFSERFYDRLFEIDPTLRALFVSTAVSTQREKFAEMLTELIRSLDEPRRLVRELTAAGRRHRDYGVADRDYDTAGAALLAALADALGPAFTPQLRDAWRETYTLLAALMRRGAGS